MRILHAETPATDRHDTRHGEQDACKPCRQRECLGVEPWRKRRREPRRDRDTDQCERTDPDQQNTENGIGERARRCLVAAFEQLAIHRDKRR